MLSSFGTLFVRTGLVLVRNSERNYRNSGIIADQAVRPEVPAEMYPGKI